MSNFLKNIFAAIVLIIPAWSLVIMGMYVSQDFFQQIHEAYAVGFITSMFLVGYVVVINTLKNRFFNTEQ